MGSPDFAVPSLKALCSEGYAVVGVVTQPDRPAGRGATVKPPAVKVAAMGLGLEVFQPERMKDETAHATLRRWQPDVLVVAAYGKILPRAVLDVPTRGSLNVHASLLPRWRGASPVAAAILAGDDETGVSIMELVAKMDAGPVVLRRSMGIEPNDTTASLEPRLAGLGAEALLEALPGWFEREFVPEAQDESLATYCPLLKKEAGHLSRQMGVADAERAVRAYNPWPGAYVMLGDERLAIWRSRAAAEPHPVEAARGALVLIGKEPAIRLGDGLLILEEVQRQGGKRLAGRDFVNGLRGNLPPSVGLA
jgi:methionyl-tRNA formyltransferase